VTKYNFIFIELVLYQYRHSVLAPDEYRWASFRRQLFCFSMTHN
jgi:hypothetical protein